MRILFITGTDTDVGKSIIAKLLYHYFEENNIDVDYFKPLQTGCKNVYSEDSDALKVLGKSNGNITKKCYKIFTNPKAPYYAAKDDNYSIDIQELVNKIKRTANDSEILICEGAGGLFVPITKDYCMIDLIKELDAEVILVTRAGLGTQNHTILSIKALQFCNISKINIIMSDSKGIDSQMIRENIEIIQHLTNCNDIILVPKIEDLKDVPYMNFNLI